MSSIFFWLPQSKLFLPGKRALKSEELASWKFPVVLVSLGSI